MPTLKSFTVSIVVNGQTLTEYEPPGDEHTEDPRKCVRYIEALEGSEFGIHLDLKPRTRFTSPSKILRIYIDGKEARGTAIAKETLHWNLHFQYEGRLLREGSRLVEQAFMFKKIITTDETPRAEKLKQIAKGVGSVLVKVYNATAGNTVPYMNNDTKESSGVVPEKALKGQPIDLTAGYGEKKPAPHVYGSDSVVVGKAEAIFEFKYRSRRALQLLDVIPATPEPQNLHERDANELNLEEARQVVSELRQQQSCKVNIKQEGMHVKEEKRDDQKNIPGKRSAPIEDDDECRIVKVKKCKPATNEEVEVVDLEHE